MISANGLRNGAYIELDNAVFQVLEFQHVKPGKGPAFVRTKIKNIATGQVLDRTFKPGEKIKDVFIEKKVMQFVYRTGEVYFFMDNSSYEQIGIHKADLGNAIKYLKEGANAQVASLDSRVVTIELENFVELKVVKTDPGLRGDTASGGSKPAELESGTIVQVPLFINIGDILKVDTRTGQYVERLK